MIDDYRFVKVRDGLELHTRIHERSRPVWIIATHGIGEHLGRHGYLHELFAGDFNIFQYDLRGHGRSQGRRGYVERFEDYALDLLDLIKYVKSTYGMERYVLYGHSMGALITAQLLQKILSKNDPYPERVFLSAPPVTLPGFLGKSLNLAPLGLTHFLCHLKASLPLRGLVDLRELSHNPQVAEDYANDELNVLALHSRLLLGMVHTTKEVFTRPLRVRCPLFVTVGSKDKIVDPSSLKNYFKQIEKNANLFVVEGGRHELHNEIKKYQEVYFDFLKRAFLEAVYPQ